MPSIHSLHLTSADNVTVSLESLHTDKLLTGYIEGHPKFIVTDALKNLPARIAKLSANHYSQLIYSPPPTCELINDAWLNIWTLIGPPTSDRYDFSACVIATFSYRLDQSLFDDLTKTLQNINWIESSKDHLI